MSQTLDAGAIAALLHERMGLSATPREAEGLALYLDLLLRWNARINLTAIREPEAIVLRHFGESLVCARLLALPYGASLLDYGSGAGFPGMVCALTQPEVEVTLAESQGKKAAFLREAARVLGLSMVRVHGERVETLPRGRRFDVVTLRAVDAMETACVEAAGRVGQEGRLAVLTTIDELPRLSSSLAGWGWREPVGIPGSSGRVIASGMRPRASQLSK